MSKDIQHILEDLEKEIELKRTEYKSYINQPSLITISSDAAQIKDMNITDDAFFSFTCNLEKPAIQVKSIQLLSANIPQAKAYSFDDTELIFPYYRIKTQYNIANENYYTETPNYNNLYYVRLLPSYYKPEIIPNAQNYGFNKTFNNYQELSDELAKSCTNDLLYTNIQYNKFIPNDIEISYNETYNKFQMTGKTTTWTPNNWDNTITYSINDLVVYNGNTYISTENGNIDNLPTGTYGWNLYTEPLYYTYLIAGYDDPNVLLLQEDINLQLNNENADFFYIQYGVNDIVSVPNQPYKKGKTLAKRLGFTWNGVGINSVFPINNTVSPIYYPQYSTLPIFFNRLRPIPQYEILPPLISTIPIPNNNPHTQLTYIAEHYCNLVFSSIINIYSNIVSASSVDTQSKRNILAITPINCGQLGVSFSNNFIENALTKINRDIYQIRIELRNEIDEPYYISNNGIVSLILKLSY